MKRFGLVVCFAIGCGGGAKKPATTPAPSTADNGGAVDKSGTATDGMPAPAPPASKDPLFKRLGGQPAIDAVVAEFVSRTTTDPKIKFRFINVDADNLKKLLSEFVCSATGGGCKYTGRDMYTAHAGMDLADEEFGALVDDLKGALDKFKVPAAEQGELLGALGPLKPEIVVSADKLKPIDQAKLDKAQKVADGLKDANAKELLVAAIAAGKRGQRSYAEQLFSRAEIAAGAKALAPAAVAFREGAPPRIETPLKKVKDAGAQPAMAGGSDVDSPDKKPEKGSLKGSLLVDGKPPTGLGVVMMWPEKGGKKRVAKTRTIEQRGKEFAPHITAVPVGSTIQFPNFDNIYHNVFSISKVKPFDVGLYKSGDAREVKFDKPGIIRLGCNIHANMSAYVIVVDSPHYVLASADGTFEFKSLAPGKYKVKAWTEQSSEPTESTLEIKAGANNATLQVNGGAAAGPSEDKFGVARAK